MSINAVRLAEMEAHEYRRYGPKYVPPTYHPSSAVGTLRGRRGDLGTLAVTLNERLTDIRHESEQVREELDAIFEEIKEIDAALALLDPEAEE